MTATVSEVELGDFEFPVVIAYLFGDKERMNLIGGKGQFIYVEGLLQDMMLDSHGNTYPLDAAPHV